MNVNYITVTEFKNMNPEIDFTNYPDSTISGMISRGSAAVDGFLHMSLQLEDISGEKNEVIINSRGNLIVYTRKNPIVSISSLQLKLGTVTFNLNLYDGNGAERFEIPSRANYILYPYQEIAFSGAFSVRNFYQMRNVNLMSVCSYRAGYETIPSDIKDAVNLWTKDIFIRQANPMDLSSANQGAVSMTYKNRAGSEYGEDSKWVRDAKALLAPYIRVTS